ncbi:hypothetical protein GBAR_LOCUS23387 [Geodia barretti]|uniref:Uncharacterized protein n=1 Tax=Geodia barretti TaxID=519541 RepID=A0AA35T865_GEOBA|nr:hypothetical protein GBAR_LOCUS23387 [Geodia barretti]
MSHTTQSAPLSFLKLHQTCFAQKVALCLVLSYCSYTSFHQIMIQSLQDCLQGMEQQQQSSNASKFVHSIAESIARVFQYIRASSYNLNKS